MATSSFYNSSGSTPTTTNSIATSVTQAATSATQAATSATQASTSATNAQNSLNSFQQYYLGAYSTPPTTSQAGAMYFDQNTSQLYIWSGTSWDVTASANSLQNTDGLTEGSSNLYFTNERVDDRVNALLTAGSNITLTYDDVANTLTIASTASGGGGGTTTFLGLTDTFASYSGQANRYLMVNSTADGVTTVTPDTDDVAEGSSNLYFTNARATSAITGSDLDMAGNKVLFGNVYSAESDLPSASTYHGLFAHVHATGKGYFAHAGSWHKLLDETSSNTDDLTEGTSNLYFTDERVDDRVNALLTAGSNITLTYDDAANTLTIASTASGGSGSSTFTGLTDTPSTMGTAGQYLAVNSGGTALEFVAAPSGGSGGSSTFTGLSDTPSSFTASKFVAVNSGGTALEYVNALTPSGLTVTNNAASGGGSLSYVPSGSGNTATLSFIPPDLSGYLTGITGESLYSLSNVYTSSSPTDGQVLTWDNANSYWKPTTVSAGGIALTDLSASNATASGGGSLAYNNSTGAFTFTPPDLSGYATTSSLSNYATTASLATVATSGAYGDLSGTPSLATVATSGAYGDLSGTPNLSGYATATSTTTFTNKSGNISQWTNDSGYLTGITGQSLYSLSNVNTSASPSDGQVLTWSNANSYWTPTTVSSGASISYLASTSTSAATTNTRAKSLALGSGATVNAGNSVGSALQKAIAIGDNATVAGTQAILIGTDQTVDYGSTVVAASAGVLNNGANQNCTVIGDGYHITGTNRNGVTLLGSGTLGTNYSTAIGYLADAQHDYSVGLGYDATTTQSNQLMLGDDTNTQGFTSIRVGNNSYQPSNAKDLTTKDYVDNRQLADLSNVNNTTPTDGQVLTWDNTNAYWYPATASSGGGSSGGLGSYGVVNSSGTAASAGGSNAIAIGQNASAAISDSIAIGQNAAVGSSAWQGIAIGLSADVANVQSVAIGEQADAAGSYQVSLGSYTQCGSSHSYGISIGNNASTGGTQATSIGRYAFASTEGVAIGGASGNLYRTRAGNRSVAIGYLANANSTYTVAVGGNSYGQNGNYSTSVGYGSTSTGNYSIALGYNANSNYQGYITLGSTSNTTLRCNATSITSLSDSRDKTEITDLDLGLDFVNAIVPKSFYRNERGKYYTPVYTPEQLEADNTLEQSYTFDQAGYEAASQKHNKKEFGWVAQDVSAQLPAAHSDARLTYIETDDLQDFDVHRFTAGDMLPIAWKALRELSAKHDQLQADYDALLARVVALENA